MTFEPCEEPTTYTYDNQARKLSSLNTGTRGLSPERGNSRQESDMPLTGDGRSGRREEASPGRFAGWLSGTSTPAAQEELSPNDILKSKQATTPTSLTPKGSSAKLSRFGFLTSSMTALTSRLATQPTNTTQFDDELLDLDIETALYPASATDRDTFSPAAYKNLQINATGLLQKMQTAYRQRTVAFQEIQAERSAENEESDEAQLRVESLKRQLEHMASQANEQELAMKDLMSELLAEKKARIEERIAHERLLAEGSLMVEDLGVDEEQKRKKWRVSRDTAKSDLSFDTDEESAESESIFSRSRSPTIMTTPTEAVSDFPATHPGRATPSLGGQSKPKPAKEMTAFQKLVKGISGDATKEESEDQGPDSCSNCHGQEASVAWDTVSLLRDENKGLKYRVAQLEVAVDGALDMVNGIGM